MNFLMNLLLAESEKGVSEESKESLDQFIQAWTTLLQNKSFLTFLLVLFAISFLIIVLYKLDPLNWRNKDDYYVRVDPKQYISNINNSSRVDTKTYMDGEGPSESFYRPIDELIRRRNERKREKESERVAMKNSKKQARIEKRQERRDARANRVSAYFENMSDRDEKAWENEMNEGSKR